MEKTDTREIAENLPMGTGRGTTQAKKCYSDKAHSRLYNDYLITLNALSLLIDAAEKAAREHGADELYDATRRAREAISG